MANMTPEELIFYDEKTGRCKSFKEKNNTNGYKLIVNVEDSILYDYHRNKPCFKGNSYAPYCSFCGKELCLYWKPEVNLVPEGKGATYIMDQEESQRYENKMK